MTDTISVTGLVATIPKHVVTGTGLQITSFRFASTQRKYDRAEGKWVDGETNWYTVATFRQLAVNVNASIQKGQRVIIAGRLRVRDWATDDKHGTNVEIDADSVGHDLSWGTTVFTRSTATVVAEAEGAPDEVAATEGSGAAAQDEHDPADAEPRREEPVGSGLPF
jgi:single-strand DNA-binding protein